VKRFTAIVALVFATHRTGENKYDLWDIQIPVEADGPEPALSKTLARLKKFEEWKVLGYPSRPVLCGVRALHDAPESISVAEEDYLRSRLPILIAEIDEQKVQLLRSYKDIWLPYALIFIDRSEGE
jgi:hypothetical protein